MRWKSLVIAMCLLASGVAFAHLCNDVFAQAKDNLAIKVDVRDGQLRIGNEASFRVYLLNTMDRSITETALDVRTDKFDVEVRPSPEWRGYPLLKAVKEGGKKEYFTVSLRRKPGVPDGKYRIELNLCSVGQRRTFKTVDLDSAAALFPLAKGDRIRVDGAATEEEWGDAHLCTDFHAYGRSQGYLGNLPAGDQARFRAMCDEDNLYLLLGFLGGEGAEADQASVHVANATHAKPVVVTFDRRTGAASCDSGTRGIECLSNPERSMLECKIPRELVGIKESDSFHINFTRTVTRRGKKEVTYWRGNSYSVMDPIVYGQFTIVE